MWQSGTAPVSDIWVSGGGGVTDGWTKAQNPVPARCLHPWLGPGDLGAGTGLSPWLQFLLGKAGPVESRNVRFWDPGGAGFCPFKGKSQQWGGGGEPAGAGPFPWGQEGLRSSGPARPPWATLQAVGSGKQRPRLAMGHWEQELSLRGGGDLMAQWYRRSLVALGTGPSCAAHRFPASSCPAGE